MDTKKQGLLGRLRSSRVLRVMFGRKIIVVCAALVVLMILVAIFAPVIAPYDPNQDDLYNVLKGCSPEHWLGTDANGRDVLSRIIYGARVSFIVGVVSVLISSVIGIALATYSSLVLSPAMYALIKKKWDAKRAENAKYNYASDKKKKESKPAEAAGELE